MDAPNAVPHGDLRQRAQVPRQPPEDGVDPVEVRLRRMRDEELAAARIRTREGHAQGTRLIALGVHFVAQDEPGTAPAVTAGIAVSAETADSAASSKGSAAARV